MIFRSLLSGSEATQGAPSGEWKVENPSNFDLRLGKVEFHYSEIDLALELAARQFKKNIGELSKREVSGLLESTAQGLLNHSQLIYSWISEESGRVEVDLDLELQHTLKYLTHAQSTTRSLDQIYPRGTCAVVGSSVWPLFYSVQFSIANLLVGNPVILKPSERVTASVLRIIGLLRTLHPLWEQVQVLVGDRELGRRLVCHESVSVVIFQGTFEVGMRIKQDTLSQPAKEVLLFLGAKNPAILLDSSTPEIEKTVIRDGFLGAGQNCFSAAQVWVKRTHLSGFLGSFHDRCKAFKIGGPQEGAFMGPILESSVMDRYFKFIGISEREGAQVLMRGKAFTASVRGNYVTPTLVVFEGLSSDQMRKSVSLQTEILAPHLSVIVYEDEDHLIETLGRLTYGHTASVYGEEGQVKRIAPKLSFARVGLNRGMYDFGPEVTAQVFKRSGNHARLGVGLIEQVSRRQWIG